MENRFKDYLVYKWKEGKIVGMNPDSFGRASEAFSLFKELYDTHYGRIIEDENLVSIHTGGWSDNEDLIREFKLTSWWFMYHRIEAAGGHYYFNTDISGIKEWKIASE